MKTEEQTHQAYKITASNRSNKIKHIKNTNTENIKHIKIKHQTYTTKK